MSSDKDVILKMMEKLDAKYILLQFTGADGTLKGVEMNKRAFIKADTVGVDGSSIGFLRTKSSDMIISPDPETVRIIPWQDKTVSVFCDLRSTDTKDRISADPRGILAKTCDKMEKEYNACYYARPEMEFYVLTEDMKPVDTSSYMSLPPRDRGYFLRKLIVETLDKVDLPYKTFHSEVGKSQHEIEFGILPAVRAADGVQLFKQIAKMTSLYETEEWMVTFMPKPFIDDAGNGMHIHQMVTSMEGENLFKGSNKELTEFCLNFIAGQLHYAPEIAAVTNPIINSYRRLVPGIEAPVYITWGVANRTALIRVPGYEAGRLEYRAPDASTNIYFALALLLEAGMEGVKNKMNPPSELNLDPDVLTIEELKNVGIDLLPRTLEEALKKFKSSKLAKNVLGEALHKQFYDAKVLEWEEFTNQYSFEKKEITPYEIEKYLDC